MLNLAVWLLQVWQTGNAKLSDYCAKPAAYLCVSSICINFIMSYSELLDISFNSTLKARQQQLLCVMTVVWKAVGKVHAFAI